MPDWALPVMAAAGIVASLTVLLKALRTTAKLTASIDAGIPLWKVAVKVYGDVPELLSVNKAMAEEFKSDGGSTLRDSVNAITEVTRTLALQVTALERATAANSTSTGALRIVLDQLAEKVYAGAATGLRNEEQARIVAANLVVAQKAVEGVASDLAESHRRADAVPNTAGSGAPGEAADAASRSPVTPEESSP